MYAFSRAGPQYVNAFPTRTRYKKPVRSMFSITAVLAVCAIVASCDGGDQPARAVREDDPAIGHALAEPITIDPDLAAMNRANSAASMPSQDGSLPTIDNGPEIVAAARSDALELIGGAGKMRPAPQARQVDGELPPAAVHSGAAKCAERVQYTMLWAARLPAPFPVYPRGAVQDAAGTDAESCALRVINFVTPVPLDEVMDFYFTRARGAGFSAQRIMQGGDDILSGTKGTASYSVRARRLPSGNTEVDLTTDG